MRLQTAVLRLMRGSNSEWKDALALVATEAYERAEVALQHKNDITILAELHSQIVARTGAGVTDDAPNDHSAKVIIEDEVNTADD